MSNILWANDVWSTNGGGDVGIVFSNARDPSVETTITLRGPVIATGSITIGSSTSNTAIVERFEQNDTALTVDIANSTNVTAASATFYWTRVNNRVSGSIIGTVDVTAAAFAETHLRVSGLPGISANFAAITDVYGSGAFHGGANASDGTAVSAVVGAQTIDMHNLAKTAAAGRQYHVSIFYLVQ
jgi:hypothetical protein